MAPRDDEFRPRRRKRSNSSDSNRPNKKTQKKKKGGLPPLAFAGIGFGGGVIICAGLFIVFGLSASQKKEPLSASQKDIIRSIVMPISKNNLKLIGLALHNYHDVHRTFPPGSIFDEENNVNRHSWMTMILPFMDQAPLYNEIKSGNGFHVAWNDPQHESTGSFKTIIPGYLNLDLMEYGRVDGYAAAHYTENSQIFFRNSKRRIRDFTDGTSNTIIGGEISSGFMAWGNPENIRDPANGVDGSSNGFGSPFKKDGKAGAQMLFGDGRVRFIPSDIDPEILKALSTYAGGEAQGEY